MLYLQVNQLKISTDGTTSPAEEKPATPATATEDDGMHSASYTDRICLGNGVNSWERREKNRGVKQDEWVLG